MKIWLKGGLIGFLVPLLISGIVYKAPLFHPWPFVFVFFYLLPAVFWMVVGIGAGLMVQKKINTIWKILILLIILMSSLICMIQLWGFQCFTLGGSVVCPFSLWLVGIAYPMFTHGMCIISGPAFVVSLILIILSVTRVLKDKEIRK